MESDEDNTKTVKKIKTEEKKTDGQELEKQGNTKNVQQLDDFFQDLSRQSPKKGAK